MLKSPCLRVIFTNVESLETKANILPDKMRLIAKEHHFHRQII